MGIAESVKYYVATETSILLERGHGYPEKLKALRNVLAAKNAPDVQAAKKDM